MHSSYENTLQQIQDLASCNLFSINKLRTFTNSLQVHNLYPMSIDNQVEYIMSKRKAGTILFSEDFQKLNNSGAVKVALHILVKCKRGLRMRGKRNERNYFRSFLLFD